MKKLIDMLQQIERIENDILLTNNSHAVEIKLANGLYWIGRLNQEQMALAYDAELRYELENLNQGELR